MNTNPYLRLLAFICGALFVLRAQPATVFPSDVQAPAAEFLQAVCPGQADPGGQLACTCPPNSGLYVDGYSWKLAGVTRGHFVSPASDDAVLSMDGCEPHSENWGGTVLLTRKAGGWVKDWYKPGVVTSQCRKVELQDHRQILVCMGVSGSMGASNTELYVEDLLRPGATLMAEGEAPFFQVNDDVLACGTDGVITHSTIESVRFSDALPPAISVTASLGKGPAAGCKPPPLTRFLFEFAFDGRDYQLGPVRSAP